jgi:hypothetical protein
MIHPLRAKAQIERNAQAYRRAFDALVEAFQERPDDPSTKGVAAATEESLSRLLDALVRLEPVLTADLEAPVSSSVRAAVTRAHAERDPRLALEISDLLTLPAVPRS